MLEIKDKLHMKEEADINRYLEELDSYKISFPNSHTDIDEDLLKDKLEKCNLAQDALLRVERIFREDIAITKLYARRLKTLYKISYNELLSEDDRKISVELKKASVENKLKDQIFEMHDVESWLVLLENSLEYVLSKRSDIKQKSIDFKTLFKLYTVDREALPVKSFYSSWTDENKSQQTIEDLLKGLD